MAEVAVHVGSGGVAGLTRVDDDDRPALTAELKASGEAGSGATDDGDVAMALDGT